MQDAVLVAPESLLNLPAGQSTQVVLPSALHCPSWQHAPAPALLFLPVAQVKHDDAPPVLNVPCTWGEGGEG